ncbi:MAG TPA: methyltransferase domain-containing protein [Mycobacteriales bacterium]|nr:methyltransferase domain-containing protein [Mycobacteriales bacterium]
MLSDLRHRAARAKRAGIEQLVATRRPEPAGPNATGGVVELDEVSHAGDELHVRGSIHHPDSAVVEVGWSLPGHGYHRLAPAATHASDAGGALRFDVRIPERDPNAAGRLRLLATLADGRVVRHAYDVSERIGADPYHQLQARFFALLADRGAGRVLELGSRARSGNVRRDLVPTGWTYVGVDILPGPNVDVVADAHTLSRHVEPGSIDAVFSFSTFEHLAMPWRVAVELNKVLTDGALVLVTSHQTYPLHDEPWDYWRFSSHAWPALFNAGTGFEVVASAMGEPAAVVPHAVHPTVAHLDRSSAFLGSAVIARKVGPTALEWDCDLTGEVTTPYPV